VELNEIAEVRSEWVYDDGTIAQNIFNYVLQGTAPVSDAVVMTALAQKLDALYTELDDAISDTLVIQPYMFNIVAWSAALNRWYTKRNMGMSTASWTPANVNDPFPNQVAAVITAATSIPTIKGRKFFGGFSETTADGGNLNTATMTALAAAAVDYTDQISVGTGETLKPVVCSTREQGPVTIFAAEVNSILGTMRRRKPGVGT